MTPPPYPHSRSVSICFLRDAPVSYGYDGTSRLVLSYVDKLIGWLVSELVGG